MRGREGRRTFCAYSGDDLALPLLKDSTKPVHKTVDNT